MTTAEAEVESGAEQTNEVAAAPKRRSYATLRYVLIRVLRAFLTIYVVATATFFLVRLLPGNPIQTYINQLIAQQGIGYDEAASQAAGLFSYNPNENLLVQYFKYLGDLAHGDLGNSLLAPGSTVMGQIAGYLPWTLFSVGVSLIIAFVLGITIGMAMAYRRGGIFDHTMTFIGSLTHSVPNYLVAIIIITVFGVQLGWMPIDEMRGSYSPGVEVGFNLEFIQDALYHAALPMFVYVLTQVGGWMLIMKASTIETLGEDYVTVARARGLTDARIQTQYVGRNAMLPLFTNFVLSMGVVFGGSILVETFTQYQGIGYQLNQAIMRRDYTILQGILLILTTAIVVANLAADLLYSKVDPRIRIAGKEG